MRAVKISKHRDQHNSSNSVRRSSIMGQPAICSTATYIVQRPVRLHAVAVKLACRKSAFNRSNAQLQAARLPARTASCRRKTVMGLPIPIIGKLVILEA